MPTQSDRLIARCGDCLYWHHEAQDSEFGECRKLPPLFLPPAPSEKDPSRTFPPIFMEDWCGEFIHRELGGQYADGPLRHGTVMQSEVRRKQWRFPTEPE